MKGWLRRHRRDGMLMLVGALVAVVLITPAGAHVGGTVAHLWGKHIKPRVTQLTYTKTQADNRFQSKRVLQSGESLHGTFGAGGSNTTGAGGYLSWAITWDRPLATGIAEANIVDMRSGDVDPNCPGMGQAAPGYLCLYNTIESSVGNAYMYSAESDPSNVDANRGVVIYWDVTGDAPYVGGTWTMTAP